MTTLKYRPQDPQNLITTLKVDLHLPKQSYANSVIAGLTRKSSFTNITNQISATT